MSAPPNDMSTTATGIQCCLMTSPVAGNEILPSSSNRSLKRPPLLSKDNPFSGAEWSNLSRIDPLEWSLSSKLGLSNIELESPTP